MKTLKQFGLFLLNLSVNSIVNGFVVLAAWNLVVVELFTTRQMTPLQAAIVALILYTRDLEFFTVKFGRD